MANVTQPDLLSSLSPNTSYIKGARGDVKFFIVYKGDTMQLPVNPASIQITSPNANKTIPIVSLGEINILKDPKLQSISFKSFFPVASAQNYPYVLTGNSEANFYTGLIKQVLGKQNKTQFLLPEQYVKVIEEIRNSKEIIRLIILGLPQTINGLFSIEKFDYGHEEADYDISYDIQFKKYQLYAVQNCTLNDDGSVTVNSGQVRIDDSDSMLMPYAGCKVNVNGTIYKDPAMQFVDRSVKNKMGAYVGLVDFDNNGAIHLRNSDGSWLGWVSDASVTKATGL